MEKDFINRLYKSHQTVEDIPSPSLVCNWLNSLLKLLFPELAETKYQSLTVFEHEFQKQKLELKAILGIIEAKLESSSDQILVQFLEQLPSIHNCLLRDAKAILEGDPAASSQIEVIRTYPGFFALAIHRIAHALYNLSVPLIPRVLNEHAHSITGIDIHPGATIGQGFCIDHGTGVVLGETVIIGENVKLYQGVTLGALSVKKEMAKMKRHPTIEDNVVIYANATILGGETVIGHNSIIGGNVWIIKSVPPRSRIYYQGEKQLQL